MIIKSIKSARENERKYQGPKVKDTFYQSAQWRRIRNAFIRANPYCVKCAAKATVADHIVRRKDGGSDDHSNLRALCFNCHQSVSAIQSNKNRKKP